MGGKPISCKNARTRRRYYFHVSSGHAGRQRRQHSLYVVTGCNASALSLLPPGQKFIL